MRTPTFELHRSPAAFIAMLEVDSQRYTVAVVGTTMTFTNSAVFTETASVGLAKVRWVGIADWHGPGGRLEPGDRAVDRTDSACGQTHDGSFLG
jgi:hypothetical protein